ncbi:MAG: hypothetical protein K0R31_1214 [Clostridiales bacterium]|jgi:hypothetical protein|nr:hypothetical protein [Clostridiales bacterium]
MRNAYREHPRVHDRKLASSSQFEEDSTLDLSIGAAVGILAVVFVKGLVWGYILRRSMD